MLLLLPRAMLFDNEADVTAPGASLVEVIEPSGTVSARIAYPTETMRWSGVNCCEPRPPLNQTRKRTSLLAKTVDGIGVIDVSPTLAMTNPLATGKVTAAAGS